MTEFDSRLSVMRSDVESCLRETIQGALPDSLYEPIRYVFDGRGKRLRPILCILCATVINDDKKIYTRSVKAGTAIEILHNFTLVHDDIMDNSTIRRGRQSVHKRWNDATAILSGDTMLGIAYRLIAEAAANSPMLGDIISSFSDGLTCVCEGQALDMEFQHSRGISMGMYFNMIEKKTAKLVELCAETGAMLAGGNTAQVSALGEFAHNLGVGFQIQDDILDLTANQQEFGKPVGNDIIEGKNTYLIVRAKEKNPTGKYADLLEKFFDQNGLSADEIPQMHELLLRLGVLEDARREVEKYSNRAAEILKLLPDSMTKEMLLQLNNYLTGRRS